ncbi:MAG: exodeoxyribonuclease VII small subunit [Christensenellales bacterium]|jgi:exodeoxyribonuclease VII small subunit
MAKKLTYEDGMTELEAIVASLEKGDMPLEQSFKAFERGVELSEKLKKILSDGDARIRELTAKGEVALDAEDAT